jgi:hypothetical protein
MHTDVDNPGKGMGHSVLQSTQRIVILTQIRNIKKLRTEDKGWSSSLGVGQGANNFSP